MPVSKASSTLAEFSTSVGTFAFSVQTAEGQPGFDVFDTGRRSSDKPRQSRPARSRSAHQNRAGTGPLVGCRNPVVEAVVTSNIRSRDFHRAGW